MLVLNSDCSRRQEELQQEMENLTKEEEQILARQNILKKELYGRFGDSINLEN
jgi:chaperonin cofactor prefoldin